MARTWARGSATCAFTPDPGLQAVGGRRRGDAWPPRSRARADGHHHATSGDASAHRVAERATDALPSGGRNAHDAPKRETDRRSVGAQRLSSDRPRPERSPRAPAPAHGEAPALLESSEPGRLRAGRAVDDGARRSRGGEAGEAARASLRGSLNAGVDGSSRAVSNRPARRAGRQRFVTTTSRYSPGTTRDEVPATLCESSSAAISASSASWPRESSARNALCVGP